MNENIKIQNKNKRTYKNIDGFILVDKPYGETSNRSLQTVKRLKSVKKAGHGGSLDPIATGMLVIALGQATKFLQFFLDADKRYQVTMKLGERTNTCDTEGEVIETKEIPSLSKASVDAVLNNYRGNIKQTPPMYSALKHNGQPLYKLARQGVTVERKPRDAVIHDIQIIDLKANEITLDVTCSKGTYIRTLVDDIGQDLGCGAHVIALRRLSVGHLTDNLMVKISDINADAPSNDEVIGIDALFPNLPKVELNTSSVFYLMQGNPVLVPKLPTSGEVLIYDKSGIFLGLGTVIDDGRLAPKRMLKVPSNMLKSKSYE